MPVININEIVIRKRLRKVNQDFAKSLAEQIKEVGLMTPILLSGKTLVAGAHRLEAYKILGRDQIAYSPIGDVNDPEYLAIYEIDENLFRHELSPAERAEHITKRVEIMAKRKMSEKIKTKEEKSKEEGTLTQTGKVYLPEQKSVDSDADAEAKKELAENLGIDVSNLRKEIANHRAVTEAGLDQNKLEELNGTQYKRVASVAKKEGAEAAKVELEHQLVKVKMKDSEIGGRLKESVISHDWKAKLKQDINVLLSARAVINRLKADPKLNSSDFENEYFESCDLNPLIEYLKSKAES